MISPGMSSCEHSLNTLRYADRVKELAATDPTEVKVSPTDEGREPTIEEQSNTSVLSDSDLAQLRSLNVRLSHLDLIRKYFVFITVFISNLSIIRKARFHKICTLSMRQYQHCKC